MSALEINLLWQLQGAKGRQKINLILSESDRQKNIGFRDKLQFF